MEYLSQDLDNCKGVEKLSLCMTSAGRFFDDPQIEIATFQSLYWYVVTKNKSSASQDMHAENRYTFFVNVPSSNFWD